MILITPNGSKIVGTYEVVYGCAEIIENSYSKNEDGEIIFEWYGNTEIYWDDQMTVREDDQRVFIDEDGDAWSESDLILVSD